jgi:hypothetical protein
VSKAWIVDDELWRLIEPVLPPWPAKGRRLHAEPYGFVNGNPLNDTDPSGLCGLWRKIGVATVVGAVVIGTIPGGGGTVRRDRGRWPGAGRRRVERQLRQVRRTVPAGVGGLCSPKAAARPCLQQPKRAHDLEGLVEQEGSEADAMRALIRSVGQERTASMARAIL